jgi:hypothetical protein
MEISYRFWIPDITNWRQQQEEMRSNNAVYCNEAHDIISIILHTVRVDASFPLGDILLAGGIQKPQAGPFTTNH